MSKSSDKLRAIYLTSKTGVHILCTSDASRFWDSNRLLARGTGQRGCPTANGLHTRSRENFLDLMQIESGEQPSSELRSLMLTGIPGCWSVILRVQLKAQWSTSIIRIDTYLYKNHKIGWSSLCCHLCLFSRWHGGLWFVSKPVNSGACERYWAKLWWSWLSSRPVYCVCGLRTLDSLGRTKSPRATTGNERTVSSSAVWFCQLFFGNAGANDGAGLASDKTETALAHTNPQLMGCSGLRFSTCSVCVVLTHKHKADRWNEKVARARSWGRPDPAEKCLWSLGLRPGKYRGCSMFCCTLAESRNLPPGVQAVWTVRAVCGILILGPSSDYRRKPRRFSGRSPSQPKLPGTSFTRP